MKIKVTPDIYEEIKANRLNNLPAFEEWDPTKGFLFIECGEDLIIADVLECESIGGGSWMIIFRPIGSPPGDLPKIPTKDVLKEDTIQKSSQKQKGQWRNTLKNLAEPWHGYMV